jgi:hypothetical protein
MPDTKLKSGDRSTTGDLAMEINLLQYVFMMRAVVTGQNALYKIAIEGHPSNTGVVRLPLLVGVPPRVDDLYQLDDGDA